MSYQIADVDGLMDQGPSISGLAAMKKVVAASDAKDYPAINYFLEQGHTNKLIALAVECKQLAKHTTNEDVQHSFKQLAVQAGKAKEIIVLHQ